VMHHLRQAECLLCRQTISHGCLFDDASGLPTGSLRTTFRVKTIHSVLAAKINLKTPVIWRFSTRSWTEQMAQRRHAGNEKGRFLSKAGTRLTTSRGSEVASL